MDPSNGVSLGLSASGTPLEVFFALLKLSKVVCSVSINLSNFSSSSWFDIVVGSVVSMCGMWGSEEVLITVLFRKKVPLLKSLTRGMGIGSTLCPNSA